MYLHLPSILNTGTAHVIKIPEDINLHDWHWRRRYILTPSLIGWVHTQNIPCLHLRCWRETKPKLISTYRTQSNCKLSHKTVLCVQSQYLYIEAQVTISHLYETRWYPRQQKHAESHNVYEYAYGIAYRYSIFHGTSTQFCFPCHTISFF